jgi:transcriptional regulator with XRE-family HTH domain
VDTGVGATLREARNRRKVDLSEVEAAIKIRIRYLAAIENEEWDALPGGAYTHGFVRTYALYLGLDGDRLAEDYRRSIAPTGGERVPKRIEPVPTAIRGGAPRLSNRVLVAVVCLALVAVVVGIALAGGGGDGGSPPKGSKQAHKQTRGQHGQAGAPKPGVAMRLAATGEVWVCLLDAEAQPLVNGQILDEGAEAGPFHSDGFEAAFGNGSVKMFVDDKQADIPESSSPVGYAIDSGGKVTALAEGERPSCE